ncbi:ATP-dependent RNA helicase DHX30-like [Uloborus diversus]|uniref:ATP-dependent RNA helicase DHX30-like n=1 Tax=Uloborus diversus TaxID=327109 RepID=UPI0024095D69|nr:ATP-dependent RNA helicase DHX30-like [Uloborus diversus]
MRNAGCIFALRSLLQSSRVRCSTQNKLCTNHDFKRTSVKRLSSSLQSSLQNATETDIKQQADVLPEPKRILWKLVNDAFAATQKSEIKPTVTVQQIAHGNERLWKVKLNMNWPERFEVEGKAARKLEAENLAYQHAIQKMKELGVLDSNNKPVLQKDIVTFGDSNLRVAKGILCNIFQRIWMKHGKKEYIPEYNTQMISGIFGKENYWKSELLLKYPEEKRFEGSSSRLRDAEAIAAVKALHWLWEKGVINKKKQLVEVSKSEEAKLAASHFAPHSLCIPPDLQDKMEATLTQIEAEKDALNFPELIKTEMDIKESPIVIHDIITEKVYCEPSEEEIIQRSSEMYEKQVLLQDCKEPEFQELKTFRAELPINQKRTEILKLLEDNQVVVLSGETGCGKTTQVPQFILEDYISKKKGALCNIVVTQPRRISAISIAECVSSERNEKVGDTIGYQVRLNKNLPEKKGAVLYCTTGMLLRKMCSNPKLQGVSHIIVDEIHERNIPIDFLLILLKKILEENKSIKLLMMSASFNTFTFSQYFNHCPVIHVPGKMFPVKEYFLEDLHYVIPGVKYHRPSESALDADLVAKVVNHIHSTQRPGAILCFLPGWHEIQAVQSKLLSVVEDESKLMICPAHSRLPHREQQKIFTTPPPGTRKVILATNIAETSITINDVVYVVNCGLHKGTSFDCERGIASLGTQWITKANVRQRRGRAGRLQPGLCYHLFDRKTFMTMEEYPTPELLRTPLESVILDCKLYCPDTKAEDFLSMALQPPSKSALQAGISELQLSSILDDEENLAPLGKIIVNFGTHPRLSVALIYAAFLRCLDPVLTICAMLTLGKEPFLNNVEDKSIIKEVKTQNDNYLFSDHLALARIFADWEKINDESDVAEYMKNNLLDEISLNFVKELKSLFAENLFTVGAINSLDAFSDPSDECNRNSSHIPSILAALTAAFYPNIMKIIEGDISHGRLNKDSISYSLLNGQRGHIQRESVASKECELPSPWFIYFHALKSDARRMIMTPAVSSVPGICLALFAGKELIQPSNTDDTSDDLVTFSIDHFKKLTFSCSKREANILINFQKQLHEIFEIYLQSLKNNNVAEYEQMLSSFRTTFHPVLKEILETPQVPFTKGESYKFINNTLVSEKSCFPIPRRNGGCCQCWRRQ